MYAPSDSLVALHFPKGHLEALDNLQAGSRTRMKGLRRLGFGQEAQGASQGPCPTNPHCMYVATDAVIPDTTLSLILVASSSRTWRNTAASFLGLVRCSKASRWLGGVASCLVLEVDPTYPGTSIDLLEAVC